MHVPGPEQRNAPADKGSECTKARAHVDLPTFFSHKPPQRRCMVRRRMAFTLQARPPTGRTQQARKHTARWPHLACHRANEGAHRDVLRGSHAPFLITALQQSTRGPQVRHLGERDIVEGRCKTTCRLRRVPIFVIDSPFGVPLGPPSGRASS